MTPQQLADWMHFSGTTKVEFFRITGVARSTLDRYLDGKTPIPKIIALACKAIDAGIRVDDGPPVITRAPGLGPLPRLRDIGQEIQNAREARGWSREDLAKAAACPVELIEPIESGDKLMSDHLPEILGVLDIETPGGLIFTDSGIKKVRKPSQ